MDLRTIGNLDPIFGGQCCSFAVYCLIPIPNGTILLPIVEKRDRYICNAYCWWQAIEDHHPRQVNEQTGGLICYNLTLK